MRTLLLLLLSSLSLAATAPTTAPPSPAAILGRWQTADKMGIIQIYQQQNQFFGKIAGPAEPSRRDEHNPNPKLRGRELLGTVILQNFRFDGARTWDNGTIYDPNNGKTYSCTLKLRDANTLEVRGYVGISLLGRTEVWTRLP
ncbi:DUF2147 domain-containing protein [Hymenobacter sp. BT664]|uniref:DUF2147 domain-containing protein n=1 Tax=Hymenobacter montanus TaxID=2771359 RepID=A0A927GJH0_9BACT|nr:DUF2147 domain-containing protein [Hymenobacter montanus]MBD2768144.1 DUF2147 domain-containing protein [Hymenobacter montanus]